MNDLLAVSHLPGHPHGKYTGHKLNSWTWYMVQENTSSKHTEVVGMVGRIKSSYPIY